MKLLARSDDMCMVFKFRLLLALFLLFFVVSCKEKTIGEYPVGFPDECVAAYDEWRNMLDAMEESERLRYWIKNIEDGRQSRKIRINVHFSPRSKKQPREKMIADCIMVGNLFKTRTEIAKRADSMSYEEFKKNYGGATDKELDMIFAR